MKTFSNNEIVFLVLLVLFLFYFLSDQKNTESYENEKIKLKYN